MLKEKIGTEDMVYGPWKAVYSNDSSQQEGQQLISSLLHELSAPVYVLKSNIELLLHSDQMKEAMIREEAISLCAESVDNISTFLENVRLLNSSLKNKTKPTYSAFNPKKTIYKLFLQLQKQNLDAERIQLKWELMTREFVSDLSYIQTILLQLCSNALKFSGGKVLLLFQADRSQMTIGVMDNGRGIPINEQDKIFKPFIRGSNIRLIPGIGLGLAVVESLTKSLNGKILLASRPNRGTYIKIILPNEPTA